MWLRIKTLVLSSLLFWGSLSAGCSASDDSFGPPGTRVLDQAALLDTLRAGHHRIETTGNVTQPFFSVPAQTLKLDGGEVQILEYSSPAAAKKDAESISPDGRTVRKTQVGWVAPPHFYRQGKIIALYLGSDAGIMQTLASILGPQFAGAPQGEGR
jgi:hypothetical protein